MAEQVRVAISSDFLGAFAKLPRPTQGKVTEFINKFRNDPTAPGIHYEKICGCADKKFCSVRIDDTYRGIVVRQPESNVYLLLWVDHHDEAYDWAIRRRCEVNPRTGSVQVYDVLSDVQDVTYGADAGAPSPGQGAEHADVGRSGQEGTSKALFGEVSDADLLELGVPQAQLPFIRSLADAEAFHAAQSAIPADAYENLSWLAEGFSAAEVLELAREERGAAEGAVPAGDLAGALDTSVSMKSFVVVEGEDELRDILAAPLEKWRIFLHPTQRKIVRKQYTGPARVLGGAGTGKTVVAMHRAKHLASRLESDQRILFTTFTANLASDIRDNLRGICTNAQMRRIEVIHLDAWVNQFLRESNYSAHTVYGEELEKIWEEAVILSGTDLPFESSFYEEEWNRVVIAQEALTLEQYVRASRSGRGTRLDRKKRIAVWKVLESYYTLLKERQVRDINTAMYECSNLLRQAGGRPRYAHIIVDEGQDFSDNAYRLLRALAGDEHPNDLFIVGDSHQRIYKNRPRLSRCGINVRGRSSILRINYRTTEEIRKAAFALLEGISFDDLDDAFDMGDKCRSLMHGPAPLVRTFHDAAAEFEYIVGEVRRLQAGGVDLRDICVVARTGRLLDDYIASFTGAGIRVYEIRRSKSDDRGFDGLRAATMHRVKGLEFQYVFIAAVNDRIVPNAAAISHTDAVSEAESIASEKCLLYVALTRAQKGAYVTCYGRKSEFLD